MGELSDEELVYFRKIALKAAKTISSDDQVFEGAANHAVMELIEGLDDIDPDKRDGWVWKVAANDARRIGKKLHRDVPFGRQGTFPPPRQDADGDFGPDQHYARLVQELPLGMSSPSVQSVLQIVIEQALDSLSPEARFLIEARYVAGRSTKDIAAELGKEPGAIDVAIHRARKALALLLADDPRVS
ncbi:MAG: sigma-70 family RNA polymerase sigma factor [Acidimicrobiia bacterium]|nr:sigma-70 family RNA polymerase sigma factor [Acidimicrobiia bacterium]